MTPSLAHFLLTTVSTPKTADKRPTRLLEVAIARGARVIGHGKARRPSCSSGAMKNKSRAAVDRAL